MKSESVCVAPGQVESGVGERGGRVEVFAGGREHQLQRALVSQSGRGPPLRRRAAQHAAGETHAARIARRQQRRRVYLATFHFFSNRHRGLVLRARVSQTAGRGFESHDGQRLFVS